MSKRFAFCLLAGVAVALAPESRAAADEPSSLSAMLGMKVHDRAGRAVGSVDDVVVDPASGRVQYLVVASGGVLGIGRTHHAVMPTLARLDGTQGVSLDLAWSDVAATAPANHDGKPRSTSTHLRRASEMLNAGVRDSHGGKVGKVKDVFVDLPGARISQVVVAFDRAWNPDGKLMTLPMSSFADGAADRFKSPVASGAAPPRNTTPPLALMNPSSEPTKGTASAEPSPGGVETRPQRITLASTTPVTRLPPTPLRTTTSYADDEMLVYKGTREQLQRIG